MSIRFSGLRSARATPSLPTAVERTFARGAASLSMVFAGQTRVHCEWDRHTKTRNCPDGKTFQASAARVQPPMLPGPSTVTLSFQWERKSRVKSPIPGGMLPNFSLSTQ